ncbi:hypothetical protein [Qaidamihabitans albus]|uniref:hypothetical protein n=1 Tax=Qaidamihabitans albus TaxID=2795733 RepID=UPI0018F15212|nr:hypothetical protein [Qaidamihabitans albus]
MEPDLPANPLSVELTFSHRRLWWQAGHGSRPERCEVSADVWQHDVVPDGLRHVGDISLVLTDAAQNLDTAQSVVLGEWVPRFLREAVADREERRLEPALEAAISPGPALVVIVRRIRLAEPWQGHGLGVAILASSLRSLSRIARMAICRPLPADFAAEGADAVSAERNAVRAVATLERIGFWRWRGVHVIDLRSRSLLDARTELLHRWWPKGG